MPRKRSDARVAWTLTALGFALVLLGVILWASDADAAFGWFSHEPVTEEMLSRMIFMTGRRWAAFVSLGAGLMLLAGAAGFSMGIRRNGAPTD